VAVAAVERGGGGDVCRAGRSDSADRDRGHADAAADTAADVTVTGIGDRGDCVGGRRFYAVTVVVVG
jgi:hypothetical protein